MLVQSSAASVLLHYQHDSAQFLTNHCNKPTTVSSSSKHINKLPPQLCDKSARCCTATMASVCSYQAQQPRIHCHLSILCHQRCWHDGQALSCYYHSVCQLGSVDEYQLHSRGKRYNHSLVL